MSAGCGESVEGRGDSKGASQILSQILEINFSASLKRMDI